MIKRNLLSNSITQCRNFLICSISNDYYGKSYKQFLSPAEFDLVFKILKVRISKTKNIPHKLFDESLYVNCIEHHLFVTWWVFWTIWPRGFWLIMVVTSISTVLTFAVFIRVRIPVMWPVGWIWRSIWLRSHANGMIMMSLFECEWHYRNCSEILFHG